MIKEVAIEPEVMATWQHFRDLWDDLGVSRGRLVAEYPADWRDTVIKLACNKSVTKAGKILACLKPGPGNSAPRRWIPTNRAYPKGNPNDKGHWLKCAEGCVSPQDFDAIVAEGNPRQTGNVLVAGDYLKDHATWAADPVVEIPRSAKRLLECAEFLLRVSNELVLVEPNFEATLERFREPLDALVNCRPQGQPWKRLELHVKFPTDKEGKYFPPGLPNQIHNMGYYLAPLVPVGSTLTVFFWQRKAGGKRLHPRYILTELGGLQPDIGLDEGDAEGDTTTVGLVGEKVWETLRGDYCAASQTFYGEVGWRALVSGRKT